MMYLIVYLAVGFGFALASYLDLAEMEVNKGNGIPPFFCKTCLLFWLTWPLIARYCWRAEVKKTIAPVDFDKLRGKK